MLFYDTVTRLPSGDISEVGVGSLPDMLTLTHDGNKLLVANEATPNVTADAAYAAVDPTGSVSIIDMETRTVVATAVLNGVPTSGANLRLPISTGMDFEPEYIAVNDDGTQAFVTVQEAKRTYAFIGLGARPGAPLRSSTSPALKRSAFWT